MRFATWVHDGRTTSGVVSDDGLHAFERQGSILELVRAGLPAALEAGSEALGHRPVQLADVRLLPPLDPPTVRDFAAFEEHMDGAGRSMAAAHEVEPEWYKRPVFYFSNPYAMIGAHDDVAVPPACQVLDYELEIAAVVSRDGMSIAPDKARDHIFGYTIFNDWSARDTQLAEMKVGLGPTKGKDFATTLGPFLVTADELDPHLTADGLLDVDGTVSVNGTVTGRDNLRNMSWSFDELVAQASRGTWVKAGDVLGSGTFGNGGCLGELWGRSGTRTPAPLQPGDVVEMTVATLGTIRNTVVRGPDVPAVREARRHDWNTQRSN
ncbi:MULTISPECIES: fumarylacetoacetate hydrolase family protein [unclassified Rhodococcus (in: high G+C Gram-positive bacteria)]|uniref:fumarylacetoacetate hydrolase family protein n=1 Tax=unclassified Rhodococcus (in: high G+C Gram-positive bacteria) TaxID=192944 RepID=UPI0006F4CB41|nr:MULTISPECIES: fumarylacetoacetate hydrolase family protein [unclassified Rhodococcus (in: high G+C Gram-positive bacteria)]KQU29408.1 hydroxylase [Rhodococcus sp. Leaf225]KQU41129.1 hydroxylase [Rhodococcus sp. Leaf258]